MVEGGTVLDLSDFRIERSLKRERLELSSVLEDGRHVQLQDIANLSVGGKAIDCSSIVHEGYAKLAANIAEALSLRFCGVDLLVNDIAEYTDQYVVLEVNSAPGLDNYLYQTEKPSDYVEKLYAILLERIASRD